MSSSMMLAFFYRLLAPPLFLPWILTQFVAAGISWFFLALWALWAWNTTFYYIPLVSVGVFILVSPVQVNQRIVIGIVEQLASYLDTFIDDIILPIIENLFYIISPACWSINFLWDGSVAIFRIGIWNPVTAFMTSIFPINPFDPIMGAQIQAGSFPITTVINTASSPSWIVGPYDRANVAHHRFAHLINGSRSIDASDSVSRHLLQWLKHHRERRGERSPDGRIHLVVHTSELETWTDPKAPEYMRRTIAERVLRRTMDRELGLETKGWWEPEPDAGPQMRIGSQLPVWVEDSEWGAVFGHPTKHIDWGEIGVVELDVPPDLPAYARERGMRVPPGSKAYRFLSDDKGERVLPFPEMQAVAQAISFLFDGAAQVFLDLLKIAFRLGRFLFSNMTDFFDGPIEFMANFMNQFFRLFLNLPCLQFDSIEVFAISLLDCICGPLKQAVQSISSSGTFQSYWNYSRPTSISDLPQAFLSCIGLGCLDVQEIISGGPDAFFVQLLGGCFQLPNRVVCCLMRPEACIPAMLLKVLPCTCGNTGVDTATPPSCNYPFGLGQRLGSCIVTSLMSAFGCSGSSQDVCALPLRGGLQVIASDLFSCIIGKLFDSNLFLDLLESFIPGIPDGAICDSSFCSTRNVAVPDHLDPEERYIVYGDRSEYHPGDDPTSSYINGGSGFVPDVDGTPRAVRYQYDAARFFKDHPEFRYHRLTSDDDDDDDDVNKAMAAAVGETLRKNASNAQGYYSGEIVDSDYYGKDYQVSTLDRKLREHSADWQEVAEAEDRIALFEARMRHQMGQDPAVSSPSASSQGNLFSGAQSGWNVAWSEFVRSMEKESPERHRARIRAEVDRLVFNNPYIRIATGRFVGIFRDLIDHGETLRYGPDPFVRRPIDAPPLEDDDIRKRYEDHTYTQSEAYMIHAQAVADNPYYAGLYKVLIQIGAGESEYDMEEYGKAMEAMSLHANESDFHMGRIMSSSRQLYSSIGSLLEEVWWDPDSFSFHFPLYPQIHEILLRSHLPTYLDDMRSAIGSWARCMVNEADAEATHETMQYLTDDDDDDDETRAYPLGVYGYSWFVQSEIAIRSAAIRLLSPRHLQPMLEQVATHSPIHAHYAYRMSQRVEALREASPHYLHTFEGDLELMFEKQLAEAREEMDREAAERKRAGFLGRNELTMRLDPAHHPDLGNRSLRTGERVTFEDGRTGVFLGTQAALDRSLVERLSPTRSAFDAHGIELGGMAGLQSRAYIVAVFKGIVKVAQVIWRYRKWIVTGIVALITTPWGRVIWESWLSFFWLRIVRPLYTKGLDSLFGSAMDILNLIADFATLNTTVVLFLVNEMLRYILCGLYIAILVSILLPFYIILSAMSYGVASWVLAIIAAIMIGMYLIFPNCPPEQVIENNRMTQSPLQYVDDIFKCFGKINLNDIPDQFGKGSYNGICHVREDCPGNAPCVCENKGGQMSSIVVEFVDETECGTMQAPTGQCLCFPKYNCEFLFPRFGLQNLFDVDCRDYGYELDGIVWYQTSSYFLIFWNAHNNFWVSLRYITRTLTRAPGIPPLLFPVLISLGMIVLLWVQLYTGLIVIALTLGYEYGLPQWKRLCVDVILPALRIAHNSGLPPFNIIANWLAGFLRFPNHTTGTPLGSMRSGEGICFIFNTGTLFGGGAVTFFFWGLVLLLFWYGMGPILWLLYNLVMTPIRMAYAPIWLYLQQSGGQESVDAFKDKIRRIIPGAGSAMDIGGKLWTQSRPFRESMIPRQPDTYLNRWIGQHVSAVDAAFSHYENGPPRPVVIQGGMPGFGAGTLDHDIFQGRQPYAGGAAVPLGTYSRIERDLRQRATPTASITELPDDGPTRPKATNKHL